MLSVISHFIISFGFGSTAEDSFYFYNIMANENHKQINDEKKSLVLICK